MRGIIVLGPEATGTRYTEALLRAAGAELIVRRSLPYDTRWPHVREALEVLDSNDVRAVVTSRRIDSLAASQVRNGHARDPEDALRQTQRAYSLAITGCVQMLVPFILTSYEAFADAAYRLWVCTWALGSVDTEAVMAHGFIDGNAKYDPQPVP